MDSLFGKYAKKLKEGFQNSIFNFTKYFKRLLFPIYLFPVKILTYLAFLGLVWDIFVFPFKSLKKFLKSIVVAGVAKAYEEGKIDEIAKYCKEDVEVTRKIYKRMMFE